MQLDEILEENSVKSIFQKTAIPEEKIEYLLHKEFNKLSKVQALGFLSILEREYKVDLNSLKEEINTYHAEHDEKDTAFPVISTPFYQSKRRSKWFFLLVLITLGYTTWYFLQQYDKAHLNTIFPMNEESSIGSILEDQSIIKEGDFNIINVIKQKWADVTRKKSADKEIKGVDIVVTEDESVKPVTMQEDLTTNVEAEPVVKVETEQSTISEVQDTEVLNKSEEKKTVPVISEVFIIPVQKLWFGLVNLETKKRKHYSISEKFAIDVTQHAWLAATSSAPFSLDDGVENKIFQDAREHYFKLDKEGIKELSRAEYIVLGGWGQW